VTLASPVPRSNDMVAPPMSLELHERGTHAVCTGGREQRAAVSVATGIGRQRRSTRSMAKSAPPRHAQLKRSGIWVRTTTKSHRRGFAAGRSRWPARRLRGGAAPGGQRDVSALGCHSRPAPGPRPRSRGQAEASVPGPARHVHRAMLPEVVSPGGLRAQRPVRGRRKDLPVQRRPEVPVRPPAQAEPPLARRSASRRHVPLDHPVRAPVHHRAHAVPHMIGTACRRAARSDEAASRAAAARTTR
jgi:hypothetical protein